MKWIIIAFVLCLLSFSLQANASEYPTDYLYATKAEMKRLGNDLTEKIIDSREAVFEWWLMGTAILITFAGIAIAVSAFLIGMHFRDMKSEAKEYVEEIKKGKDYANQMIGDIEKVRKEAYAFKF